MTAKQWDRFLTIADKAMKAYVRMVDVMERRLALEHPAVEEPEDAAFVRVGESGAHQPESRAEYEEFPGDETPSFEKVLKDLQSPKG